MNDNKDLIKGLIGGIRSINHAERHKISVGEDDEPCYWQREEWVDWMLELADEAEQAITD